MELELQKLTAIKVLGRGAMGTVFLVRDPSCLNCPFALKVVEKNGVVARFDADRRARWETTVLSRLSHPFLPNLLGSTETEEYLAWALPYCPGGDLNQLRYRQTDHIFSSSAIRFYVAEIVSALEYLHRNRIVYRDLKPENVLIQASGHVLVTDFDLSRTLAPRQGKPANSPDVPAQAAGKQRRNMTRVFSMVYDRSRSSKSARVSPLNRRKQSFSSSERSNSFVGTEEYVSPEVVRGDGHEFAVDWWALGILTYEMAYGRSPFLGKNRKDTFRNVLTKTPEFVGEQSEMTDLISRLLEKDPTKRLGYVRGATEVKEHPFFRGLQWDLLTEVSRPPFLASTEDLTVASSDEFGITEHFEKLRLPVPASPTFSASGPPSPSFECRRNASLTEF